VEIGPLVKHQVLTLGPDESLAEAARRMKARKVGSAVVAMEDVGPGIITERDLLSAIADGRDLEATPVTEYMTATAITASSSWDVRTAAETMTKGGFRHLVVLNDRGEVSGMLSVRDLVPILLDQIRHD
jgi:CBS domain-containing protein